MEQEGAKLILADLCGKKEFVTEVASKGVTVSYALSSSDNKLIAIIELDPAKCPKS